MYIYLCILFAFKNISQNKLIINLLNMGAYLIGKENLELNCSRHSLLIRFDIRLVNMITKENIELY